MPSNERRYVFVFWGALFFLLLWSAGDYGGRYLHVQAFTQVLGAGIVVLLALQLLRQRDMSPLLNYPMLKPSLLWLLTLGMSWIFSVNRLASLEEIWRWMLYLLLGLGVYGWLSLMSQRERAVRILLTGTQLIGCGVVLWGYFQRTGGEALSSTFYRTNDLAGYLLLLVPVSLHLLINSPGLMPRLAYGLITGVLGSALVLTNSRSSWIAGLVACGLVLFLNRAQLRHRALRRMLVGGAALTVLAVALSWQLVLPRMQSLLSLNILKENATVWRLELLEGCWRMFLAHPVLGSGPNTFASAFAGVQQQAGYSSINPHNFYLQALAETGLLGFLALLFWIGALYLCLSRRPNLYSAGVMGGLTGSLLHIGFDIDFSVTAIPILFGVLLGAGVVTREKPPLPEDDRPEVSPEPETLKLDARPAGVLIFCALGLAVIPCLNYFSARAYQDAATVIAERPEAGLARLKQAIALAPWPSGRHYSSLAEYYQRQNELEPALAAVTRAIELDMHNHRYYGLAAEILLAMDRKPAALAMLLRRQELNPYRHPHIYTELGDFYAQQQHEPREALNWYSKGLAIFTPEALSGYERYTPQHRYEVFMLMLKQAALHDKLNETAKGRELRAKAQVLLHGGSPDMFVTSGYGTPVEAVTAYWQQVPEHYRNPSHQFDSLVPGSQIQAPPPQRLDASKIQFIGAERDLFDAVLLYAIPRQEKPESWLLFEDRLKGGDQGWKIFLRRNLR